jgi:HEPN domain-containing protein
MATSADLARRLLDAAKNDELMARSVLPVEGVTDAGLGNLVQQAVEKAIKAVLAANAVEFPFTHNLRFLGGVAKEAGIEFPVALDGVEDLTPFALAERYGAEAPLTLDRDRAMRLAKVAIEWARTIVDDADAGRDSLAGDEAEPGSASPGPEKTASS